MWCTPWLRRHTLRCLLPWLRHVITNEKPPKSLERGGSRRANSALVLGSSQRLGAQLNRQGAHMVPDRPDTTVQSTCWPPRGQNSPTASSVAQDGAEIGGRQIAKNRHRFRNIVGYDNRGTRKDPECPCRLECHGLSAGRGSPYRPAEQPPRYPSRSRSRRRRSSACRHSPAPRLSARPGYCGSAPGRCRPG